MRKLSDIFYNHEKFIRYHPDLKIIATGSSSFYIDKKFSDSLIGRKRLIQSSTLNFREFLLFTGHGEVLEKLNQLAATLKYRSNQRTKILSLLEEYLQFGGYPDVVLSDSEQEKRIILENIATDVVKKDLIDSGLTDDLKYFQLMRLIAGQVLENYFFRLLWEGHNSLNLHYWRTADKYEVDFVVEKNRDSGVAYEVKWNGETPLNRGQIIFSEEYPDFPITKICWDNPNEKALDILRFHGKDGTKFII